MTRVTLVCPQCGHTARRGLMQETACRGTHETISEPASCPNGHGELVRQDGVDNTDRLGARLDPRNTAVRSTKRKRPKDGATLSLKNGKMTIRARGKAAGVLVKLFAEARRK